MNLFLSRPFLNGIHSENVSIHSEDVSGGRNPFHTKVLKFPFMTLGTGNLTRRTGAENIPGHAWFFSLLRLGLSCFWIQRSKRTKSNGPGRECSEAERFVRNLSPKRSEGEGWL